MALRRVLADPEFIFRFEPTPAAVAARTPYRVSDTELASRLSFFLWSSIPDDELLKLAIDGTLHQPAVLEKQTRRMLADPKARALVTNFANQWLYLRDLKSVNPDITVFPDFDDNLRQGFQRETEMLFESVMREDRPVLDLLDADYTFVNERLAKHYGIPQRLWSGVPPGSGPERRAPRRAGTGQPAAGHVEPQSHVAGDPRQMDSREPARQRGTRAARRRAAARGEADRHREIGARAHRAAPRQPGVRGCHKIMDPIGLSLENFDADRPLAQ